jgi:hypothetical protein
VNSFYATLSPTQKYLISIERNRWRLIVLFAMPTVVVLSQCTGVRGWGWPSSSKVSQKIIPSLQLRNRAPSSALATDATTKRSMVHSVKNCPFSLMGSPSFGSHPKKKWPHARLWAFVSERYDASECMFNTMLDAQNRTVASGCVAR